MSDTGIGVMGIPTVHLLPLGSASRASAMDGQKVFAIRICDLTTVT
jgi:hypothetical protein